VARQSAACAAAETYRESVNRKDLELLRTLFADDVVLSVPTMSMELENPDGVYRGIEEAMGFFSGTSFKARATLTYTHVYSDGRSCVVELKGRLPAGNDVEALDIFTVDDSGKVERMTVYARIAS
jgi:ketosteroid isomerase-like protein